jgi:hypothetical protein
MRELKGISREPIKSASDAKNDVLKDVKAFFRSTGVEITDAEIEESYSIFTRGACLSQEDVLATKVSVEKNKGLAKALTELNYPQKFKRTLKVNDNDEIGVRTNVEIESLTEVPKESVCAVCGEVIECNGDRRVITRHIRSQHRPIITRRDHEHVFFIGNGVKDSLSSQEIFMFKNFAYFNTCNDKIVDKLTGMDLRKLERRSFSELNAIHHPFNSLIEWDQMTYDQFRNLPAFSHFNKDLREKEFKRRFSTFKEKIHLYAIKEDLVIEIISIYYGIYLILTDTAYSQSRLKKAGRSYDYQILQTGEKLKGNFPKLTRQDSEKKASFLGSGHALYSNVKRAVGFIMALQRALEAKKSGDPEKIDLKRFRNNLLDLLVNLNVVFDDRKSSSYASFEKRRQQFEAKMKRFFQPTIETGVLGAFHEGWQGVDVFPDRFDKTKNKDLFFYLNIYRDLSLVGKIPFFSGLSSLPWQKQGSTEFHNLDYAFILIHDPVDADIPKGLRDAGYTAEYLRWLGPFIIVDDKSFLAIEPAAFLKKGRVNFKDFRGEATKTIQRYLYDGVAVNRHFRTIALVLPDSIGGGELALFRAYMRKAFNGVSLQVKDKKIPHTCQFRTVLRIPYGLEENDEIIRNMFKAANGEAFQVEHDGERYEWKPRNNATINDYAKFLFETGQKQKVGGRYDIKPEGCYDPSDYLAAFGCSGGYSMSSKKGISDDMILANPVISGKGNPAWDEMPDRIHFLVDPMQVEYDERLAGNTPLSQLLSMFGNTPDAWHEKIHAVKVVNHIWQLVITSVIHGLTARETREMSHEWAWSFEHLCDLKAQKPKSFNLVDIVTRKASNAQSVLNEFIYQSCYV